MRLLTVDARGLLGLKYKSICHFKLVADMVGGGVREFVYDVDGPAFLKRELMGFSVGRYWRSKFMIVCVDRYPFMHFESI